MKKIFLLPVLLVAAAAALFILSSGRISEVIEITEVFTGDFPYHRDVIATVDGHSHPLYFPGNIMEVCCEEGDEIRKNQTVLYYGDIYGNRRKMISPFGGIVVQIENGMVLIKDLEPVLKCRVDLETRSRLTEGSTHLFTSHDRHYRARVSGIPRLGVTVDNRLMFEIELSVEGGEKLLIGQSGILTLDLGVDKGVLLVDKRALFNDEKGYYLLERGYLEDPGHPEDYRLKIELIRWDDANAMIRGTGLESVEVCILSDELKEILDAG